MATYLTRLAWLKEVYGNDNAALNHSRLLGSGINDATLLLQCTRAFHEQNVNSKQLTDGTLLLQLQLMMPEILTWSLKLDELQTAITQLSLFRKLLWGQVTDIVLWQSSQYQPHATIYWPFGVWQNDNNTVHHQCKTYRMFILTMPHLRLH